MENSKSVIVKINQCSHKYEKDTTYLSIAKEFQEQYQYPIILARKDGKLIELFKKIHSEGEIDFVTIGDKVGNETYRRTATLLLTKAVKDIIGHETRLIVQFSVDKGYYCEIKGYDWIEESLVKKIEEHMRELVKADHRIIKKSINTDEAIKLFNEKGMEDKANLFRYRRASRVNVYILDDIIDYYYGYMAPSTGFISKFNLITYKNGFVMQMPTPSEPDIVPEFNPSEKIFNVLKSSTNWGERLGICTTSQLNDCISNGDFIDLMLVSEALQEKKIAEIAEEISKSGKRVVLIAGPSSSGKTTFSHRLSVQLRAKGLVPHPLPVDDYFVDREFTPLDENGKYNYECLGALNIKQLNQDLTALLNGEKVELPTFNFILGKSEYGKNHFMQLGKGDVLVIEGIHCLNDALTPSIPNDEKYRIYISALTQLNLDEHNRIPTTDGRLIRRIVRDAAHRGAEAAHTISMWYSVRRGEEENIFPYQENADAQFNSALIYELAVLKQFAEPLLFKIKPDLPEYEEAKRLLKFLGYFIGVSSEDLPKNSIIREFIGGSYFNV